MKQKSRNLKSQASTIMNEGDILIQDFGTEEWSNFLCTAEAASIGLVSERNKDCTLDDLRAACDLFVEGSQHCDGSALSAFDALVGQMHGINYFIDQAEKAGHNKETILNELNDVRKIQGTSPFVNRLQTWPRGYPGDFETVEYLMESVNQAQPGSIAYWIEQYCLNTAVAQQHRNKVRWQAEHIERAINEGDKANRSARILILACGSSPDVRLSLDRIINKDFLLVLSDMDERAITFSAQKLSILGDRVKPFPGNMFRQINKFAEEGPFDLVLAGGLFDYLTNDQSAF